MPQCSRRAVVAAMAGAVVVATGWPLTCGVAVAFPPPTPEAGTPTAGYPVAATDPNPPPPPTVSQRPVRPLGLPERVSRSGWTSLLDVPIPTNAGLEARVRATCTPRRQPLAPTGDDTWCRVTRTAGKVRLWLSGTRGAVVRVVVSAPAVEGYTAYRSATVYRTTRVR